MDFSGNVLDIELGYLVRAGSPVASFADVDRPGIRIGVTEGGTSHRVLPSQFRHATVVPASSMKNAIEMLASGKVDAYATNKPILFEMSDQLPNSRVLEGGWGLEHLAIAIPKGRDSGLPFLHAFAEDAKSRGLVERAAARVGMRGITKPR